MPKSKSSAKNTKSTNSKSAESNKSKAAKSSSTADTVTLSTPGDCLSFSRAGMIVQKCAGGPHDIDLTLEDIDIFTEDHLDIFRECVFEAVLDNGCQINRGDIPNAPTNTLREVRDTIANTAD